MNEVGEGPDHGHAGKGNAEQDDVQEADSQDVRQPHSSAVHHSGVGVNLAVRRAHVHDGGGATSEHSYLSREKWLQLRAVLALVRYHSLVSLSMPSVM